MSGKKTETRFTIQFSQTDPSHIKVFGILNEQGRRKTQYIVNAVLHYINCEIPSAQRPVQFDEKAVEMVVNRILREKEGNGANKPAGFVPVSQAENPHLPDAEIEYDESMESIGADGLNAITDALAMFRKK